MTRYNELCDLHFASGPRLVAIDRILRELPEKMRRAIGDQLQVPSGIAMLPTDSFNKPMPYVGLYRQYFDRDGSKKWEPCEYGSELTVDIDGGYSFIVGICVERGPNAFPCGMLRVRFSVEAFSEHHVEVQVYNLGRRIVIDPISDEGYASAANEFLDRLLVQMKEAASENGRPTSIGFAPK